MHAQDARKVNGVLDDVHFFLQSGANVERGVGDQQRLAVQRDVEAKYMRHASPRAQLRAQQHGVNQLVGVQAAFHQHFHFPIDRHFGRFFSRRMAVRYRDDLDAAQVDASLLGDVTYAPFRTDQHRHDQAVARRVHGTAERTRVAGMHHRATHRRQARTARQQFIETGLRVKQLNLRRIDAWQAHLDGGGQHPCRAVQHALAFLIEHLAIQLDTFGQVVFADHRGRHGERVTDANGFAEVQHLILINGAGAGKLGAQQGGNQGPAPHAVGNYAVVQSVVGVDGIQVRRVGVTRYGRKGLDIVQRQRAQQAGALAQRNFVVSDVFNQIRVQCEIHGNFLSLDRVV